MHADAPFDLGAVERAAAGRALKLPRVPHRGRTGEVRASSVGSSMELHDFRTYHPGDDLRHVDWNAVARTGELVVRVRQDEVSPRVEIVVDASASMAVSAEKASRTKEVTLWLCELAMRAGADPTLVVVGRAPQRVPGSQARLAVQALKLDGREPFDAALRTMPPLRPCGLRVVVSDFLIEANPGPLAERLSRQAAGCTFLQVLDAEDLEPSGGAGARLVDSESGEMMERVLLTGVIEAYRARFEAHVRGWQSAAQRVAAGFVQVSAEHALPTLARAALMPLVEAA